MCSNETFHMSLHNHSYGLHLQEPLVSFETESDNRLSQLLVKFHIATVNEGHLTTTSTSQEQWRWEVIVPDLL